MARQGDHNDGEGLLGRLEDALLRDVHADIVAHLLMASCALVSSSSSDLHVHRSTCTLVRSTFASTSVSMSMVCTLPYSTFHLLRAISQRPLSSTMLLIPA